MTPAEGGRAGAVSARAPGKCIVFGEHAVVHGGPELLFAVDLYTQVVARPAASTSLNSDPDALSTHPYLRPVLESVGCLDTPMEIRSVSRIPRSAGLGSSAAFVAALTRALLPADRAVSPGELAQRCFTTERKAQGVGSPGDTSASVAGGYLAVNASAGTPLWTVQAEDRSWEVRRIADPSWVWVVAYSGIPRSTAEAVRAVTERLREADGEDLLSRFADVARRGTAALERGERDEVGRELDRNQELLREVGVSHPRLEAILSAVGPVAHGAKLTGAGRGGSIVALPLPGRETEAMRRLARAGAVPFAVKASATGAEPILPP